MKKKKNVRKSDHLVIDGLTLTRQRLKYQHDGWSCGTGKHRNKKAYRRKGKYPEKYE